MEVLDLYASVGEQWGHPYVSRHVPASFRCTEQTGRRRIAESTRASSSPFLSLSLVSGDEVPIEEHSCTRLIFHPTPRMHRRQRYQRPHPVPRRDLTPDDSSRRHPGGNHNHSPQPTKPTPPFGEHLANSALRSAAKVTGSLSSELVCRRNGAWSGILKI